MKEAAVTRAYRALARSRAVSRAALRARNIATALASHRLADGIDPHRNGELWLLQHALRDASVVLDVGANVGDWSALALAARPELERLVMFEPSQEARQTLLQRFGDDGRVEIIDAAVSDRAGQKPFFEETGSGETSSLLRAHSRTNAAPRTVRVVTLDEELARLGVRCVDMAKVDAEGLDLHVIRGAEDALARGSINVLQFEYNQPWLLAGSTLHAAISFLESHGYEVFLLKGTGLHRYELAAYGELFAYANFVAISPAWQPRFADAIHPAV